MWAWLILFCACISFHTAGHDVNLDCVSVLPSFLFTRAALGAEAAVMFALFLSLQHTGRCIIMFFLFYSCSTWLLICGSFLTTFPHSNQDFILLLTCYLANEQFAFFSCQFSLLHMSEMQVLKRYRGVCFPSKDFTNKTMLTNHYQSLLLREFRADVFFELFHCRIV